MDLRKCVRPAEEGSGVIVSFGGVAVLSVPARKSSAEVVLESWSYPTLQLPDCLRAHSDLCCPSRTYSMHLGWQTFLRQRQIHCKKQRKIKC